MKKNVIMILFSMLILSCDNLYIKEKAMEVSGVFLSRDITTKTFAIVYKGQKWAECFVRFDIHPSNLSNIGSDRQVVGAYTISITPNRTYSKNENDFIMLDQGNYNVDLKTKKIKLVSSNNTNLAVLTKSVNGEYNYSSGGYQLGKTFNINFSKHPFFNQSVRNNYIRFHVYE